LLFLDSEYGPGIPKWEGCVIGGAVAIVYCTAGGLMSSAFVNMFELAVTMSGLLLAISVCDPCAGGWGHVHELVLAQKGSGAATESMFSMVGVGRSRFWRGLRFWCLRS